MMLLHFAGTRGCIEESSHLHARHSALQIVTGDLRLWIDCGLDWLPNAPSLPADAILLTHAHSDHAFGLQRGAPCPVYATAQTWEHLAEFPIEQSRLLWPDDPKTFGILKITAIPVRHSLRAPTIAMHISNGRNTLFYAPDIAGLIDIHNLAGVDLYIGDGAAFDTSLLRIEEGQLCGHAPIQEQLDWCATANVPRALFTHCGTPIVTDSKNKSRAKVCELGAKRGIEADLATDGLAMILG